MIIYIEDTNIICQILILNPIRSYLFSGIKASRSPHTGVWIEDNKVAAIGIHASRYVTSHGISLNCDNDLSWFEHIVPCGIEDKGVTSLTNETGVKCSLDTIIPLFLKNFERVFECKSEDVSIGYQEDILSNVYSKLMSTTI